MPSKDLDARRKRTVRGRFGVGVSVLSVLIGCQGAIEGPTTGGPTTPGGNGSPTTPGGGTTPGGSTDPGNPGTTPGGSSDPTGPTGIVGDPAEICAQAAGELRIGRTRLRRMTRPEFNHTVRDLLGINGTPADAISPDESIGPFYSNAIAPITELIVQQHEEVAASLATQAASRMAALSPCDLAADTTTACASRFIDEFGLKAFRRPLDAAERDAYVGLFTRERARSNVQGAFTLVVETLLESPFFLYHADVGPTRVPSDAPVRLTSYELASRLSYFLWGTMPDTELFGLAAANSLQDDATLTAQVDRMLRDPRAVDAIPAFHLAWLGIRDMAGIDKDTARFPLFNDALAEAMRAETAAFSDFVVRRGDGLMRTLFTAGFSFPQGPLFQLYGLTQPGGFNPGDQVPLNTAQRSGILTQAAFLTAHAHRDQTSPVHRGILVRENILCQPLAPPPPNVNTVAPPVSDVTSTRQRFLAHEADPQCAGCHTMIDPIGLGFEHYDAIGAFRTVDGSQPVDASGEVFAGGADVGGPFNGALELAQKLAGSRQASNCLANQWFRFALGRMEASDDACSVQRIHEAFVASGGNIRQLLVDLVKSDAFRHVRTGAAQ